MYARSPRPPDQVRPSRGGVVLSVGRRVFVNCPGNPGRTVALTDDTGQSTTQLADGVEVEIVAWRPRGGTATRYRVHAPRQHAEGWLAADQLRPSAKPAPPAAPAAPARADVRSSQSEDAPRKFGARK